MTLKVKKQAPLKSQDELLLGTNKSLFSKKSWAKEIALSLPNTISSGIDLLHAEAGKHTLRDACVPLFQRESPTECVPYTSLITTRLIPWCGFRGSLLLEVRIGAVFITVTLYLLTQCLARAGAQISWMGGWWTEGWKSIYMDRSVNTRTQAGKWVVLFRDQLYLQIYLELDK